jgi:hypothetical protein
MRWILLGVVLGLLVLYPTLLAVVVAVVAGILSKPALVAFGLGLAVRPHLPRMGRWAR